MLHGRVKAPFAPVYRHLLTVPGMDGAHLNSSEVRPLTIRQPIGFKFNDEAHDLNLKDELAEWLITDEPVPLQFDDEPDRTYFALVQNTLEDFDKFADLRTGTIQFLCLDPYGYGPEQEIPLVGTTGTVINVKGNAVTKPIFELEVLSPITFAMVSNGEEFMLIGQPIDVKQTPVNEEEIIFHHHMESMTGWVETNVISEGYINGSMDYDETGFFPIFAEPNPDEQEWHGPAMKHSLSEAVQDFKADMGFRFYAESKGGSNGRIEMYGLDANNSIVFRAFIEDKWIGQDHFGVQLELNGGEVTEYLTLPKTLEDMYGRMKVIREGNTWTLILQLLRSGAGQIVDNEWRRTIESNQSTQEVSQIQLSFQKFFDSNEEDMKVLLMRCYKLNDVQGIPYIAQPGDMITFDHRDKQPYDPEIRINGELRNDLKDFGATPFSLKPGENTLALLPENALQGTLRYRPAYK